MSFDFYTILTILILITAIFSYINERFIKLPVTIGVMLLSMLCSIVLVLGASIFPEISSTAISIVRSIDFEDILLDIMLSFLLFAGAIHVDVTKLRKVKWIILSLASIGIIISTTVVGLLAFYVLGLIGLDIDLIYCLLFGALISPTDPIAVLGILKKANLPDSMGMKITGESLFNDGVAVVLFLLLLGIAGGAESDISTLSVSWLVLSEVGGGILWGILLGFGGNYLLRTIDNYNVEVLITLSIVMAGYAFASWLHISGPLAMVLAGLITGTKSRGATLSDISRDYLSKFWELLDELLNAILFLLIGLELLVISFQMQYLWAGIAMIPVVLLARWISVLFPVTALRGKFERHTVGILTWGGLRGGISVALALSIPMHMHRPELLTITYIVVVFSIFVQGLTIGSVAKRLIKN